MAGEMKCSIATKKRGTVDDWNWNIDDEFINYDNNLFEYINQELKNISDKYEDDIRRKSISSITTTDKEYKSSHDVEYPDDYSYECEFTLQAMFDWFDKYKDDIYMVSNEDFQVIVSFMYFISRIAFEYNMKPSEILMNCSFDFN